MASSHPRRLCAGLQWIIIARLILVIGYCGYGTFLRRYALHSDLTRQWNAANMSSGIYYYRLSVMPLARPASLSAQRGERDLVPGEGDGQASSFVETKKLVLLK